MNIVENAASITFDKINTKRVRPWKGEEEVRLAWISALESTLNVHFDAERARKDSSYNHVIIEFKAPGLFNGSKFSPKFKEAMDDRLFPYIRKESQKTGIPEEDYIGIAIDGEHVCFAQLKNNELVTEHLIPFSPYAVGLVIEAIKADTRREITIENLIADFGLGAFNAQTFLQSLSNALASELRKDENSKIKMLYEEWRTLYGQVADMSILQADIINKELLFRWSGKLEQAMSGRLFVIHTYNSLLIKLLAAEIVSGHGLTSTQKPTQVMSTLPSDEGLVAYLNDEIEKANIFSQAGISGFVEEAIFSWYLDIALQPEYSESVIPALRRILAALSLYRTDRLVHTRDVLRDLYQGLIPGRLRQSLGEFYTPDWLVEFTVNSACQDGWFDKRFLDPTCGSGAFLVSLIRRKIDEAKEKGWKDKDIISHVCTSIWGFDLNPLAVQTARVNFLMEIAFLLKNCPGTTLEIPVLMADAIYSPAPNPDGIDSIVRYQIGSQVAGLDITLPSELAFDRVRLDSVFERMGNSVESDLEYNDAEKILLISDLMTPAEVQSWREPLKNTYDQILKLHKKQWNGIWFRVVRNFFWSATAGHFDYIVGNPPWVRWSKLPEAYRQRVKPTCEKYGIFSKTKRHGGNELDISAMITYTTADKWLKENGRLAFVLTGTLFKNPSSAGFRDFKLDENLNLVPISVDDLKILKPFNDASNHTVVAIFDKKNVAANYPIPYRLWGAKKGFTKNIPVNLNLDEVNSRIDIAEYEAAPVSDIGSPWAVLEAGRFDELKVLSGACKWVEGRKGITADLNGVYFVPILESNDSLVKIKSRPEAGKKDIGVSKNSWIEPDLLYPLVKGAGDFEACYLKLTEKQTSEKLYTFVPNNGIGKDEYELSSTKMNQVNLSKTRLWFQGFKELLLNRSTYRLQMKGAPYFAIYNVGEYAFKPWKVIWPEMSTKFYAAVAGSSEVPIVGERPYIPDHKVYYASFDEKESAYFLCGLLNTKDVTEWIESHNISIQVGDVFKHMDLPEFERENEDHMALAALVELSHNTHDKLLRNDILIKINALGDTVIRSWARR